MVSNHPHGEKPAILPNESKEKAATSGRVARRQACWSVAAVFCCAVLVALLEIQHHSGVQHFAWIPAVILFAILFVTVPIALIYALRRIRRGPRRRRAFGWLLVALAPAVIWAGLGGYAYTNYRLHHMPKNPAMTLIDAAGASLMEAELAIRYPHRVDGRHVTMFHHGVERPEEDVALMDAFLDDVEKRTGRPIDSRIHWVRGTLLGFGRIAVYGLALGSHQSLIELVDGKPKHVLDQLDRHEVGHTVMYQWQPPNAGPPTVLSEGWAEWVGYNFTPCARYVKKLQNDGELPPEGQLLPMMFGPDWYNRQTGVAYPVGHQIVDFLIFKYGFTKFFEMYTTIGPDSVDETFVAVYGVDLAALEKEFWADVKQIVGK